MIYEGQWKNGKKHGYARETICQDKCYEGYFKDGDRHGKGMETQRDGRIVKYGYWERNHFTAGSEKYKDKDWEVGLWVHTLFKGN